MRAFDRRRNSARGGRCVSTTDGYARHAGDGVRPAREAVTIATSRVRLKLPLRDSWSQANRTPRRDRFDVRAAPATGRDAGPVG